MGTFIKGNTPEICCFRRLITFRIVLDNLVQISNCLIRLTKFKIGFCNTLK